MISKKRLKKCENWLKEREIELINNEDGSVSILREHKNGRFSKHKRD